MNKNEGTPSSSSQKTIMNILASTKDYENLTPIQLLGKVSMRGLELCRTSLLVRVGVSRSVRGESRVQSRIRSGSFNVNLDETESDDNEDNAVDERRVRSNSFNVHLNNEDSEDEEGEESSVDNNIAERGGGVAHAVRHGGRGGVNNNNNDLIPLDNNVDFNILGNHNGNNNNNNDTSNQQEQSQQAKSALSSSTETEDEYGCEVLTFGRADHCALGVPTFTTTSSTRGSSSNNSSAIDKNDFTSSNNSTSYKPKRVESFALGELRRGWSTSPFSSSSSNKHANVVDSPAVCIAASTHHTLVSTASGQLYSFGYNKSGRLGTGDENHRPLPTRILGSLTNRIVVSIAAATNHSLCSTNCGRVYSWGSNGHGQLGYPTSSSMGGSDNNDSSGGCSRLSPRRVEGDIKQSFVVAVAAGDRHSVALTKLGEVYCWGDNKSGQLGQYSGATLSGSAAGGSLSSPTSLVSYLCICCKRC